ncbi:MAG: cysteine desulfurase family protein [Myxococcota bacterium]|nr:cysteine desulfurase family protein [Myxococcota bacterium]
MSRIYVDHNATTPVRPEVLEAMWPFYEADWGNASSVHWAGQGPKDAIEDAREAVAGLIGARPRDLVFTSGGTESDNSALLGVALARRDQGRHVVTSSIEHKAILDTASAMEQLYGFEVTRLPVDALGRTDPEELRAALREDTVLVSIMLANNEIGNINPIAEIASIARERGILVHSDAVNALGKVPIDVGDLGVDLLSISAHKIYGPKGVGALYIKRGTPFEPLLRGGGQERKLRCGTYNTAGIVGFGKAAELTAELLRPEVIARMATMRDRLEQQVLDRLDGVEINGDPGSRLPNTTNLSFLGVDGEGLVLSLDLKGIALSTGSACTSGSLDPSHVLVALGKDDKWLAAAIRISLGLSSDESVVDRVADELVSEVARLRRAVGSAVGPAVGSVAETG